MKKYYLDRNILVSSTDKDIRHTNYIYLNDLISDMVLNIGNSDLTIPGDSLRTLNLDGEGEFRISLNSGYMATRFVQTNTFAFFENSFALLPAGSSTLYHSDTQFSCTILDTSGNVIQSSVDILYNTLILSSVNVTGGTSSLLTLTPTSIDFSGNPISVPSFTTTERDALTPSNGMIIYNTSTNKFQGRAAAAWVDLH